MDSFERYSDSDVKERGMGTNLDPGMVPTRDGFRAADPGEMERPRRAMPKPVQPMTLETLIRQTLLPTLAEAGNEIENLSDADNPVGQRCAKAVHEAMAALERAELQQEAVAT